MSATYNHYGVLHEQYLVNGGLHLGPRILQWSRGETSCAVYFPRAPARLAPRPAAAAASPARSSNTPTLAHSPVGPSADTLAADKDQCHANLPPKTQAEELCLPLLVCRRGRSRVSPAFALPPAGSCGGGGGCDARRPAAARQAGACATAASESWPASESPVTAGIRVAGIRCAARRRRPPSRGLCHGPARRVRAPDGTLVRALWLGQPSQGTLMCHN